MDISLNNLMARLAMLGVEQHLNEEALCIAQWLTQDQQTAEVACAIRITSLMGMGRCADALVEGSKNSWPSLDPWLALCEQQLGHEGAMACRLERMMKSDNPDLILFAQGMRRRRVG